MKKEKGSIIIKRDTQYFKRVNNLISIYPSIGRDTIDSILESFDITIEEDDDFIRIKNCIQNDMNINLIAKCMNKSYAWVDKMIKASPKLTKIYESKKDSRQEAINKKRTELFVSTGRTKMKTRAKLLEALGYKVNPKSYIVPIKALRELSVEKLLEIGVTQAEIDRRKKPKIEKENNKRSIFNRFTEADIKDMSNMLSSGVSRIQIREKYKISDISINKLLGLPEYSSHKYISNKEKTKVVIDKHKLFVMDVLSEYKNGVSIQNIAKLFKTTPDIVAQIVAKDHNITMDDVLRGIINNDLSIHKASIQFGIDLEKISSFLFNTPRAVFRPIDIKQKYSMYLRSLTIYDKFKKGQSVIEICEDMDLSVSVVTKDIHRSMPYPGITRYSTYRPDYDLKNWSTLQLELLDSDIDIDTVVTLTGRPYKIVSSARMFINRLDAGGLGELPKKHHIYNRGGN
ncbi:MAG: hypothetical protein ACRCXX_04050 [Cetobacterium sp.]|uniref:hypothetical protein n=1 Tax=Cetobacterium sp. TaxID=2071632 RepID=UPI003F396E28